MSSIKRAPRRAPQGLTFSSVPKTSLKRSHSPPPSPSAKRFRMTPEETPNTTTTTKILIVSDTHGLSTLPKIPQDQNIDVVLHCGDLSESGSLEDYQNTIDLLNAIPAPLKLVIPGNHDLTLDPEFWPKNCTKAGAGLHDEAKRLFTNAPGITLLNDGTHSIKLSNGRLLKLYTNSKTPNPSASSSEWAFSTPSAFDHYNAARSSISYATNVRKTTTILEEEVDIILSHGPAKYRLDRTEFGDSIGCPHLFRAIRRMKPKIVACGHVHRAYGAEIVLWKEEEGKELPYDDDDDDDDGILNVGKIGGILGRGKGVRMVGRVPIKGKETLFINAALMGHEKLENAPWLVELELDPVN